MSDIKIDVIIPVLDDLRILDAIESVRYFDDCDCTRLIVMAGRSNDAFLAELDTKLKSHDILVAEPDAGIFDALNKGLATCSAEIIGWLGADDVFSGFVRASDVIAEFRSADTDIVVYSTQYHSEGRITRHLDARWSRRDFLPLGFHNPHFSTFLSDRVYQEHRFPVTAGRPNHFSDIVFFIDLLRNYRVATRSVVCTFMAEGGSASGTLRAIWYSSKRRFGLYKNRFGLLSGAVAPVVNLVWKLTSMARWRLVPRAAKPAWREALIKADKS